MSTDQSLPVVAYVVTLDSGLGYLSNPEAALTAYRDLPLAPLVRKSDAEAALTAMQADLHEQCRLLGIGGSREAALSGKVELLERELAAMQARLDAAEEQLACVRQALPETLRNSVPSVAVATMAAERAERARAAQRNDHTLIDGMVKVPCAVMMNPASRQNGWLFIPHADGNWVSLCKLDAFSGKIIEYWLAESAAAAIDTTKGAA
jgi:cob(I)alamin adenosyltransferase